MLKPQDPLTLYGPNGQVKRIPAVDAPGWLANGWSTEPPTPEAESEPESEPESSNQEPPGSPPKRRKAAVETVEELHPE